MPIIAGAIALMAAAACGAAAQDVAGDWQGTLDSPDQAANGIPLTAVALTASRTAWRVQPPAMAPTIRNGSVPRTTGSGSSRSGASSDRSSWQAKKRRNGRRFLLT